MAHIVPGVDAEDVVEVNGLVLVIEKVPADRALSLVQQAEDSVRRASLLNSDSGTSSSKCSMLFNNKAFVSHSK